MNGINFEFNDIIISFYKEKNSEQRRPGQSAYDNTEYI